jgi:hypothetical protein
MNISKSIEGFPEYCVSDCGEVVSFKYGKDGRPLKQRLSNSGYMLVQVYDKGKMYNRYVHRLVAKAFLTNESDCTTVNHKDGNKLNNSVCNLEWCSIQSNLDHAHKMGRSSGLTNPKKRWKLSPEQVQNIRYRISNGENQRRIAKEYGVSPSTICNIHKKLTWCFPIEGKRRKR